MSGPVVPVLIASASPAYAGGLAGFLAGTFLPIVAHSVDASLLVAAEHEPHAAIVDRELADGPGYELVAEFVRRTPEVRLVVVLSPDQNPADARGAAYILATWDRDAVLEAVADALETPVSGERMDAGSLARVMRASRPREVLLTDQERVVLRLMRQHLTYKEIARELGISWHTVRSHAQSILRKLGVHSRRDVERRELRIGRRP